MKNKDLKKGKESIIGKIIYGFLLFMPLLAIITTCLYAIFNKNAYQSYSGLNENTESNIIVNTTNDFDYTKTYYIGNSRLTENNTGGEKSTGYFLLDNVEVIQNNTSYSNDLVEQFERIYFYLANNSGNIYANFYIGNTAYSLNTNNTFLFKVNIRGITGNETTINNLNWTLSHSNSLYYIDYYTIQQIDNVFYYAVDKVEESNLFNWATNSIIYTGISNTCTQLSITNTFIPLLLAYWLIISVIYILYDIILMILIILHNKIHQLQDSLS